MTSRCSTLGLLEGVLFPSLFPAHSISNDDGDEDDGDMGYQLCTTSSTTLPMGHVFSDSKNDTRPLSTCVGPYTSFVFQ